MSRDLEHPDRLARWLDQPPGTDPPTDLDPEVLEAILALRPERAPAARVTADDILASLTEGPLAEVGLDAASPELAVASEGEVVPFPAATADDDETQDTEPATARRPRGTAVRWLALMGGTGGLGLAMVAAATLLMVATPAMFKGAGPASSDAEMRPSPAAVSVPTAEEPVAADPAPQGYRGDDGVAAAAPPVQSSRPPARAASKLEAPAEVADQAIPMDDGSAVKARRDSIIPEAMEPVVADIASAEPSVEDGDYDVGDAVADLGELEQAGNALEEDRRSEAEELLEELADEAPRPQNAETDGDDLGALRAGARPPPLTTDWRAGLDGERLSQAEGLVAQADASSGAARGDALQQAASLVSGPARQVLAVRSADAYLAAARYKAAEGVARLGLSEGAGGSEGAWLQYVLGQALEAQGRLDEAASAYRAAQGR